MDFRHSTIKVVGSPPVQPIVVAGLKMQMSSPTVGGCLPTSNGMVCGCGSVPAPPQRMVPVGHVAPPPVPFGFGHTHGVPVEPPVVDNSPVQNVVFQYGGACAVPPIPFQG